MYLSAKWQRQTKTCHILDIVCALLLSAKVLALFWGEAAFHVVHTINHIPSPVIQNQTPYECLFGSPTDYHHLCSFGSTCFILFQPHKHNKLSFSLNFVVFLAIAKLKRGINVMILSLIVFVSPAMLSFGNIAPLLSSLTSVPPYLPPLSQIFFQMSHIFLLQLLLILLQTSLSNHQIFFMPLLDHLLMNMWKMNRSKTSHLTLSLGSLLLLRLNILHKIFHLVTQLG